MDDTTVDPVGEATPAAPVSSHADSRAPAGARGKGISGRVVAVHRRNPGHRGEHRLDISVGGDAHTEVVVRVDSAPDHSIEGKRVVIHIVE